MRQTHNHTTRRRIIWSVKLGVTLTLCALLLWHAKTFKLYSLFVHADGVLLAVAFALVLLGVAISALKWQLLLKVHGMHRRFRDLLRLYIIGCFFNNLLPTSIGGDSYRVYKTYNNKRSRAAAVLAVLTDRVTGLGALIVLAYIAILVDGVRLHHPLDVLFTRLSIIIAIIALPLVIILMRSSALGRFMQSTACPRRLRGLLAHTRDYRSHPRLTLAAIAFAFVFHLRAILLYWLVLKALGATVNPASIPVILVATAFISLLPLSINGIGLTESAFVFVASQLAIGYDAALFTVLFVRAANLVVAAAGCGLYLRPHHPVTHPELDIGSTHVPPPTPDLHTHAPRQTVSLRPRQANINRFNHP